MTPTEIWSYVYINTKISIGVPWVLDNPTTLFMYVLTEVTF